MSDRWITIAAIFVAACMGGPAGADGGSYDAWAREVVASGLTPGLSVAVVRDGRVEWSAALGKADLATGRTVTRETRFYLASTSKALTALATACVAARGGIDLDATLDRALSGASFPEGYPADSFRVRDLLTHTHGIDRRGPVSLRVAFTGEYTNQDLLRALGAHRRALTGHAFVYSNLGYDLAGILLAPTKTRGWKEVVEKEVLDPLGMEHTTAYRSRLSEKEIAMPHEMGAGGLEAVTLAKHDANLGPAGGHFSTAEDLARLVIAELSARKGRGRSPIPREVLLETQRLHAVQSRKVGPFQRFGWGLGWDMATYEGDTLLTRSGSFSGYWSFVSFAPGLDAGVVILSNGGGASGAAVDLLATVLYDHLRGRPDAGGKLASGLAAAAAEAARGREELEADLEKRAARSRDLPHPLDAYAGVYTNAYFGTLELRLEHGTLTAAMGVARSAVEPFDAEKNQLRVELIGGAGVVEALFEGDGPARALRFFDAEFVRR